MTDGEAVLALQAFIDERWAVAQPKFYPEVTEGPRVDPEVTPREARYFLASITPDASGPPLFEVDDDRNLFSDHSPPRSDGSPSRGHFLSGPEASATRTLCIWPR